MLPNPCTKIHDYSDHPYKHPSSPKSHLHMSLLFTIDQSCRNVHAGAPLPLHRSERPFAETRPQGQGHPLHGQRRRKKLLSAPPSACLHLVAGIRGVETDGLDSGRRGRPSSATPERGGIATGNFHMTLGRVAPINADEDFVERSILSSFKS